VLDDLLGRALVAQIASLGTALAVGAVVYGAAITALRIPEAGQIWALVRRRGG
jgi:integral membrane sensor domain MASE1